MQKILIFFNNMAESSKQLSFSSNEKEEIKGNPNLNKVSKLFLKMKLNEAKNEEKMDQSVLKEICKIPLTESKDKQFCIAGKIISFLEKISVILVQPSQEENVLLNIGSNLFLPTAKNWILLGKIDEIFGNIKDPLYAVSLSSTENNLFKVEDKVYFQANHQSTSLFHIESNVNSKYNIIHHS